MLQSSKTNVDAMQNKNVAAFSSFVVIKVILTKVLRESRKQVAGLFPSRDRIIFTIEISLSLIKTNPL